MTTELNLSYHIKLSDLLRFFKKKLLDCSQHRGQSGDDQFQLHMSAEYLAAKQDINQTVTSNIRIINVIHLFHDLVILFN